MAPRDRTIALLGALALVLLVVVGFGYAALDGRDLASFAPTLLGFATPTIVALLASAGVRTNMGRIEEKVNGNYDTLSKRNEELAAKFTEATGVMPSVAGQPQEPPTHAPPAYESLPPYSPPAAYSEAPPPPPPPWVDPYPAAPGRHRLAGR